MAISQHDADHSSDKHELQMGLYQRSIMNLSDDQRIKLKLASSGTSGQVLQTLCIFEMLSVYLTPRGPYLDIRIEHLGLEWSC